MHRRLRRALAPLFPTAPAPTIRPAVRVAGFAAAWLACILVLLDRVAAPGALSTIWAEDGVVFSRDAILQGPAAVLQAHAGYLQVLPRVLAAVAVVDPGRLAELLALLATGTAAALTLLVFAASRAHLPSPVVRAALVAAVVLLPVARVEVLANVANVQWYGLFACWWLLLWRPATRGGRLAVAAVVLLLVTSVPLALLLWPLALLRLAALRWREQAVLVAMAVGTVCQLLAVAQGGRPVSPIRPSAADLGASWLVRVVLGLLGVQPTGSVFHRFGWLAVCVTVVLVAAAAALTAPCRSLLALSVAATVTSLLLLAGAQTFSWIPELRPHRGVALALFLAGRYTVAPLLLMIVVVLAAGQALVLRDRPSPAGTRLPLARLAARAAPVVALVLAIGIGCAADYRVRADRSTGSTWPQSLGRARAVCARHPALPAIDLPQTPTGWSFTLPCAFFRPAGDGYAG